MPVCLAESSSLIFYFINSGSAFESQVCFLTIKWKKIKKINQKKPSSSWSPSCLKDLFKYWNSAVSSPQEPSVLHAEEAQLPQPLFIVEVLQHQLMQPGMLLACCAAGTCCWLSSTRTPSPSLQSSSLEVFSQSACIPSIAPAIP